ncbi:MAG TPA: methylenetetrahydrofolate reductase [Xanthobacteraceae bacterium]|nr:methylenetetrahydrofolate reductase [Xanthobacteraceae bacterium]
MNEPGGKSVDTRFAAALAAGRFAITAEIAPPLSCDPEDIVRKALPLKGLADAVNVTDGAGAQAHLGALAAAAILAREGIEPIQQFTCRDRNRIALQGDLLSAAALGVRNLLLLRGDDPSAGDQPDAKPVFDLDTVGLLRTAAGMRDRSELPSGRKLTCAPAFFLGVADSPIDPPDGWAPHALKAKVEAGAQFVQTQFCMDAGVVRRYLRRLDEHGLPARLSILIGVAPLKSARSARWMRRHLPGTIIPDAMIARLEGAADPAAEGRRICVDLMDELAAIPGVAGAHVMAPGNESAIPEVIAAAGRTGRLRVP